MSITCCAGIFSARTAFRSVLVAVWRPLTPTLSYQAVRDLLPHKTRRPPEREPLMLDLHGAHSAVKDHCWELVPIESN